MDSSIVILKDDKPKPVNLLDLSTDILNTIGDFVKKNNKEREERERERKDNIKREREEIVNSEQIINGKKIIFPTFCGSYLEIPLNTKEAIKEYIFDYIISNFPYIKKCATMFKMRLNKDDKRKCAWVLFKRCKFIFANNRRMHNTVIYNMDDDEEKEIFEEYLKLKN